MWDLHHAGDLPYELLEEILAVVDEGIGVYRREIARMEAKGKIHRKKRDVRVDINRRGNRNGNEGSTSISSSKSASLAGITREVDEGGSVEDGVSVERAVADKDIKVGERAAKKKEVKFESQGMYSIHFVVFIFSQDSLCQYSKN